MEDVQSTTTGVASTTPPEWAAQLYRMMQTQNERMVALEAQIKHQNERGARTPEVPTPTTTTTTTNIVQGSESVRRKAKLPELAEFNGKRSEFRPWLI